MQLVEGTVPPARWVVDADVVESGVAGLVLTRTGPEGSWRLVHAPTGRVVSRAAIHPDPQVLIRLAGSLASLADWSRRDIPVPGPVLRQTIEAVVGPSPPPVPAESEGAPGPATADADRELLAKVLRRVHTAVTPALFASAIADLGAEERARLRALLTDAGGRSGAVVRPLPPPTDGQRRSPATRPGDAEDGSPPPAPGRSGSATG
jgi:hypothetical protein